MPIPSDAIVVALIVNVLGLIGVFVKAAFDSKTARRAADEQQSKLTAIKHQVQNSHKTNLRDDLDEHGEKIDTLVTTVALLASKVETLVDQASSTRRDIGGIREDIRDIRKRDDDAVIEHRSLWDAIRNR